MSAVRCAVLTLSVLALAAPAGAAVQPWDQKKVAELGEQLETTTSELWNTL